MAITLPLSLPFLVTPPRTLDRTPRMIHLQARRIPSRAVGRSQTKLTLKLTVSKAPKPRWEPVEPCLIECGTGLLKACGMGLKTKPGHPLPFTIFRRTVWLLAVVEMEKMLNRMHRVKPDLASHLLILVYLQARQNDPHSDLIGRLHTKSKGRRTQLTFDRADVPDRPSLSFTEVKMSVVSLYLEA
jgi:hypothetical protein